MIGTMYLFIVSFPEDNIENLNQEKIMLQKA